MKKCPFCAEDIQDAAVKCKHCGSVIHQQAALAVPVSEPTTAPAFGGGAGAPTKKVAAPVPGAVVAAVFLLVVVFLWAKLHEPAVSGGQSGVSPVSTTVAPPAAKSSPATPPVAPAPLRKSVATDGSAFEDICENWFFYRDRTLRLSQAGDEEGAAKARKQFEQNNQWLSDYPGRTLPTTRAGCR